MSAVCSIHTADIFNLVDKIKKRAVMKGIILYFITALLKFIDPQPLT